MLKTCSHVCQITRYVIRITKIYSLPYVGCKVEEILTKGHPKVKWGQIFNDIRSAWMTYQIVGLALYISKMYTFYFILAFIFEIITFKQIRTCDFRARSTYVQVIYFSLQKINKAYNPNIIPNVFCSKHTISLKILVKYMTKHDLQKISKTLNPFSSKLIWCNIGTSLM